MTIRRDLALMLICLLAVLGSVAAFNFVANPYRAWSTALVDDTYLKIDLGQERLSTPYRVRAEAPTLMLTGTSRMLYGMWIEQGNRDGVLNAALADASLDETAAVIELALRNDRLRRIVWNVEFVAFSEHRRGFRDGATQARLSGDPLRMVRETLLSMDALEASGRLLLRAAGGSGRLPERRLLPVPWPAAAIRAQFDAIGDRPSGDGIPAAVDQHVRDWLREYGQYRRSDVQWDLFRRTVDHVRASGIELILLVPPMSIFELETIRQTGAWPTFMAWKRELSGVSPYWDFSGYNDVAERDELYTFPIFCHFKPVVGHSVLRRVLGGDCAECGPLAQTVVDAGVWVDPSTVEAHVTEQDSARARLTEAPPPAVEAVAQVVGKE